MDIRIGIFKHYHIPNSKYGVGPLLTQSLYFTYVFCNAIEIRILGLKGKAEFVINADFLNLRKLKYLNVFIIKQFDLLIRKLINFKYDD